MGRAVRRGGQALLCAFDTQREEFQRQRAWDGLAGGKAWISLRQIKFNRAMGYPRPSFQETDEL